MSTTEPKITRYSKDEEKLNLYGIRQLTDIDAKMIELLELFDEEIKA